MELQTVAEVIEMLENKWELVANKFEHAYATWRESSLDFDIAQHLYGHKLELKYRKKMMLEIGWWKEDAFDSITFDMNIMGCYGIDDIDCTYIPQNISKEEQPTTIEDLKKFLEDRWTDLSNEFKELHRAWCEDYEDFDARERMSDITMELTYRKKFMLELDWWNEEYFDFLRKALFLYSY